MIISKVFEIAITVDDPIGFMSREQNLIEYIKREYEEKCYKSTYIINIIEIIRQSDCTISQINMDASGNINVSFIAECLVYESGEIVTGCKITTIRRDIGKIYCSGPKCIAAIKIHKLAESYTVGQEIAIIVEDTMYTPYQDTIVVIANPFLYTLLPKGMIFKTIGTIEDKEKIASLSSELQILKETAKEKPRYDYFNKLLEPYKNVPKDRNMDPFVKAPTYVKTFVGFGYKLMTSCKDDVMEQSVEYVYRRVLLDLIQREKLLNYLCDNFADETEFNKQDNIWISIEKSRL